MTDELQVENGNYTRIANKIMDELVRTPLLGTEIQVCLFIIRKTYGFNKTEDAISLTQFEEALAKSRPTIVKALKNLQLVNMVKLVRGGNSSKASNIYAFNKYAETWKPAATCQLVKRNNLTGKPPGPPAVGTCQHTKDNTKENIPAYASDFLAFWEAYPNKKDKMEAWKRWRKLACVRPDTATLLAAIRRQIEWRRNARPHEFRPEWKHPATWLAKGSWDDETDGENKQSW